jgi:hypothetical protein
VVRTPVATPLSATDPRIDLLDRTSLPVRQTATATALPRVGRGSMVDLEYAIRVATAATGGSTQVWLAPGAGADIVPRLEGAGLVVVAEESTGQRLAELESQGTALALAFLLLVGAVCVLLTAVSLAVTASAERGPRGLELAALRRQGMRPTAVRGAVFGGYAALVGLAVAVGALAAILLAAWVPASLPLFGDGWTVLAAPSPHGYVVALAALLLLAVLGVVALAAATSLISSVRRQIGGTA